MANKYVYMFSEGNRDMKNILGGKGANLAEMTNLGMPIPQGFTISTEECMKYYEDGEKLSDEVIKEIEDSLKQLEELTGKEFGSLNNPLLVSVRSGARASMPGMMDTILNLGLNDESVVSFGNLTGNEWFAYDSYRRFIQMFADVAKGVKKSYFERVLDEFKEKEGVKFDKDLTIDNLKEIVNTFKGIYKDELGEEFPQNPKDQLFAAIVAVFKSWNNERAIVYRKMNEIPDDWGTAVNVQMMVFGNMGDTSGTGVAFTRNPATGEKGMFGEYLINAQGEDVVAGIRTPKAITVLEEDMPEVYKEFIAITERLENHYKDMQDMEFTIENGKLYFLQTRNGKRTAAAALKIAVDMVDEKLITKEEALMRVEPKQLDQLLHPAFDQNALKEGVVVAKGLPASPGAGAGKVYFTAEDAKAARAKGERVILARLETSPEDIEGMIAAEAVLTVRGGMTSHAAVVARGMGRCCVSGCGDIHMNEEAKTFEVSGKTFKEGDYVSVDGSTGTVYEGDIATTPAEISGDFATFMAWADEVKRLKVRTNADTPTDAKKALEFGADGIGLCRTEHMFFNETRIFSVREMILSESDEERAKALEKLIEYQREDFIKLYEVMDGHVVTIRLLDPPLHEFLPREEDEIVALAKDMGKTVEHVKEEIESLKEFNPMMGHRGCRLSVTFPDITRMQVRGILQAAAHVERELGHDITSEIMVPLVGNIKELKYVKEIIIDEAEKVIKEEGIDIKYEVGTMIEVPRAAITADEIATEAEFFSFGTNDLTQMSLGFSRDDVSKFLGDYYDNKILEADPFARIDEDGVGKLIKMAVELGRKTNPNLPIGICGEQGGEEKSVDFCHRVGLDYVSCSPYRVPIARLAAAQAAIRNR
ncbi:MAG: pyruvate, phosphate dikinase [Clostridia bacterium]|jgi:pyruvate,orthophosphate dikinase|nr:pyruvate, phosphate dikinase [Clostridia bacterium]